MREFVAWQLGFASLHIIFLFLLPVVTPPFPLTCFQPQPSHASCIMIQVNLPQLCCPSCYIFFHLTYAYCSKGTKPPLYCFILDVAALKISRRDLHAPTLTLSPSRDRYPKFSHAPVAEVAKDARLCFSNAVSPHVFACIPVAHISVPAVERGRAHC